MASKTVDERLTDNIRVLLGAQAFEIQRLNALIASLTEELETVKGKLPIETAALHEAGKARKTA